MKHCLNSDINFVELLWNLFKWFTQLLKLKRKMTKAIVLWLTLETLSKCNENILYSHNNHFLMKKMNSICYIYYFHWNLYDISAKMMFLCIVNCLIKVIHCCKYCFIVYPIWTLSKPIEDMEAVEQLCWLFFCIWCLSKPIEDMRAVEKICWLFHSIWCLSKQIDDMGADEL